MTRDPFQDILGVPESSGPQALLGLWESAAEPSDIYLALFERLIEVQRHERHDSVDADLVRRRLRSAAKLLSSAARYRRHKQEAAESLLSGDPVRMLLGVAEFTEPFDMLGLDDPGAGVDAIDLALSKRLTQIDGHPRGGSAEADDVRRILQAAATMLKDRAMRQVLAEMRTIPTRPDALLETATAGPPPAREPESVTDGTQPHSPAPPPSGSAGPLRAPQRTVGATALLTPFDRQVLAVLVGCGGWNATSRSMLVTLAEMYQVSPDGLVTVIKGLSDYARAHRSRLGVREITAGAEPAATNGQTAGGQSTVVAPSGRALDDEAPEADRFWNPVTTSLFASAITIIVGLVLLILVVPGVMDGSERVEDAMVEGVVDPDADAPGARPDEATTITDRTPPAADRRAATFATPPTFLGNGLPRLGASAADASVTLAEDFDDIERRVAVAEDPSEAVYRDWAFFIDQFATGWVLLDESTRRAAEQSVLEVLYLAADTPSVSDRLMQALTPLSGKLPEPIDVWRGAWKTHLLGRIAGLNNMLPVVTDQARRQLDATLAVRPDELAGDREAPARQWLDEAAEQLVRSTEYDPRTYDFWELWLAAQRELAGGEAHDLALMHAIEGIARSGVDLARPGPSVNVVGRLTGLITWRGEALRDAFLAMFDDPNVTSRDLWVITSLLAARDNLSWFTDELILPDDADDRFRARVRDRIRDAWPVPSTERLVSSGDQRRGMFDPLVSRSWLTLASRFRDQSIPADHESKMRLLLGAARLNESFALLFHRRPDEAGQASELAASVLVELEREPLGEDEVGQLRQAPIRPGQPIGPDGAWAARYQEIRRDTNARLQMIAELASTAGTDLGPIDAGLLVREAYRGVPEDVRTQAQSTVQHRFSTGPTVAMELLDQFPDAPSTPNVSEFIAGFTGSVLPDVSAREWRIQARFALVSHALQLHRGGSSSVDVQAAELIDIYTSRAVIVAGRGEPAARPEDPAAAAQRLADRRREVAGGLMTSVPVPDDLPGLHRRRIARLELVEGPIQRFVAEQIAALELLAYETAATHPSLRDTVVEIVKQAARRRAAAAHALDQAIETELAMTDLHRARLELLTRPAGGGSEP